MNDVYSLAPVWFSDVAGSTLMIVLSFLCVVYAVKLKKLQPSNVIWTYLLALSLALAGFSISRAVGHLAKHMLLLTGNGEIWALVRPYTGAINSIAFVLVAGVTVFFQRVQRINAEILSDKQALEEASKEVMRLNQDLESLVEQRTMELSMSEKKFRGIFEGSMDMIFVLDDQLRFEDINPAGLKTLGYDSPEQLVSQVSLVDLCMSEEDERGLTGELEQTRSIANRECSLRDRSGHEIIILLSVKAAKDETGRIKSYEGVAKDITSRRRMERQLQQADRLASLGQTAAGIAHELNTPLGVILGYSQLLLRACDENDAVAKDLLVIEKQTKNCKRIVEDLLKFARDSETTKSTTDLAKCFEEVISLLGRQFEKEGITVRTELEPDLPVLLADAEKLKQVFVNLLVNARQAISGNGEILIAAETDPIRNRIRISVSDNGCGMSQEVMDKIFDPFFTTKPVGEGTGLGLSVSYGIVQDHGGSIEVESREGIGTTFTIHLPLTDLNAGTGPPQKADVAAGQQ